MEPKQIKHPKLRPYRSQLGKKPRLPLSERLIRYCELMNEMAIKFRTEKGIIMEEHLRIREKAATLIRVK